MTSTLPSPINTEAVTIVEVAPRDGFQSIHQFIDTEDKIKSLKMLYQAGFNRMEIGAFVSPKAIPQMADIESLVRVIPKRFKNGAAVLVPNKKGAELAIQNGVKALVYVISVSEAHNKNNVNRTVNESFADLELLKTIPEIENTHIRIDLSTCFDCPFEGLIAIEKVIDAAQRAIKIFPQAEIGICDTTGKAMPNHVSELFGRLREIIDFESQRWAFHGHDTYGLGLVNVIQAYHSGVRTFDASASGLGGCPFAPGAKGNIATEDLVWCLQGMGIETNIDLQNLLVACDFVAKFDIESSGGRIRTLPRKLLAMN